jgi:hypothetical protein
MLDLARRIARIEQKMSPANVTPILIFDDPRFGESPAPPNPHGAPVVRICWITEEEAAHVAGDNRQV